jgi:hypothetical protein
MLASKYSNDLTQVHQWLKLVVPTPDDEIHMKNDLTSLGSEPGSPDFGLDVLAGYTSSQPEIRKIRALRRIL